VDALAQAGQSIIPTIHPQLDSPDPQLRKMAAVVLSRVNPREFSSLVLESNVMENLLSIYRNYSLVEALAKLPSTEYPSIAALQSALRERNQQLADEIFYLLTAIYDPGDVKIISESLRSENPRVRANATEALESLTSPQAASLVTPLFDPELSPAQLLALGQDTWDIAHPDTAQAIQQLVANPDVPWLRAITTYALGEIGAAQSTPPHTPTPHYLFTLTEVEAMLKISAADPVDEVRAAAQAARRMMTGHLPVQTGQITSVTRKEGFLLSTIEKVIFLKEVPFFQDMTIDQLKVLASACEEELFEANTRIFEEGDGGGVLYVVVSGRVAIERQGRRKGSFVRLATLEAHTCFGEMTLFDKGPRSAAAVAIQDTLTLRLRREPLVALARQYPDLSLELIHVLSQRLREANDRITQLTRGKPRELQKLYDQFD
jgi:CRP-like cAMP-binding protein